jgi:drug/metabolite transporter (DMT)-like permease
VASVKRSGAVLCATAMSILGSSFAVSRLLLDYPTLTGQAARYLIAAVLLGILVRHGGGRPAGRRDLLRLAALAFSGLAAFNVCVFATLRHADPATLGTVVGGTPLVLAVLGPLLAGRRPTARVVAGGAVVVVGIALVQGSGRASMSGLCWALGALAGEVLFSLLAAPLLGELGPVRVSAWACTLAVPQLLVASVVAGEWRRPRMPTGTESAALLYIAVVLTVVAFVSWYGGLQRLGVERAGMFAGLLPLASLVGAALIDHVVPAPTQVLGTLTVVAGLAAGLTVAADRSTVPAAGTGGGADQEVCSAARTRSA